MRGLIVWAAIGSGVLAGCALVSGLDKVGVGPNDGGNQSDGYGGKDAEPSKDGAPSDGGSGQDGSQNQPLVCSGTTCAVGQVCCFMTGAMQGSCAAPGSCTQNSLGCTSPSNCPANQVCCLTNIPDAGLSQSSCQSSCQNGDRVCDPQMPMCGGDQCKQSFKVSIISTCN